MPQAASPDSDALAHALRELVLAQGFGALAPVHPSLDLALAAFPAGRAPLAANVLFSREHPQGVLAAVGPGAGPVRNIVFLADYTDAAGVSRAWDPATDWRAAPWRILRAAEHADARVVAPYPASLIKLPFAVGVAMAVDAGLCAWSEPHPYGRRTRTVAAWCEAMLTISCNTSTSALVALLHARGILAPDGGRLQRTLHGWGLDTLRVADTRPDGGWRNDAGCGVGHLQMTAWDSVRLLWLLDAGAPPAPWARDPAFAPLSDAARAALRAMLARQGLHFALSSTVLAGLPGHVPGIPARMPAHWLTRSGGARVPPYRFPPGAAQAPAEVEFAHKTGTTDNYLSDAGIVTGLNGARRHYIVALTSNLGRRYAPDAPCATCWQVPALGRAIDRLMQSWLETAHATQ